MFTYILYGSHTQVYQCTHTCMHRQSHHSVRLRVLRSKITSSGQGLSPDPARLYPPQGGL